MDWREKERMLNAVADWENAKRNQRWLDGHRFVGWYTTAPHPRRPAHTHSADAGQVGWRCHLVMGDGKRLRDRYYTAPAALCGLRPAHGWGLDLFIDEPCKRCLREAIRRRLTLPQLPD